MAGFDLDKIDYESLVPSNLLDEKIEDPLQSTMTEAVKVNPDSHVKLKKLSRDSGMPIEAVQTDPESVESSLNLNKIDFDALSKRNPHTSKYLTDFNNASIAHDDHDILSKLENTIKIIPAAITQATLGISESIWRTPEVIDRFTGAVAKSIEDVTGLPRNLDPVRGLQDIAGFISEGRLPGGVDVGLAGTTEIAGMVSDATRTLVEQPEIFPEAFQRIAVKGQEADAALGDALKGDFTKIKGVLTDPEALTGFFAQAAPSLALAYASGGSIPFITWLEAMETAGGAAEFEKETGQKITDAQYMQATTQAGLINSWFEKIGLDKVFGAKGGGIVDIIKAILGESSTEAIQQFNSNFAQFVGFNRDQSLIEGVLASAIGGAGAGGGVSSVTVATSGILNSIENKNQRVQAQQNTEQNAIDSINDSAQKSKLRERDKESFREFMQGVNEDADVFIDGAQVASYLQEKTAEEIEVDPALQLLQKNVDEAAALEGDITIPVSDFATDVAGTEHYDALRDHMKLSPETSTPFRQEQEQKEAENYVQTLIDTAQETASEYVESQDIFESVRDQLIDTGRVTAQQASTMAQVVPAWATVQAQSRGISVQQVYTESGLAVVGPLTGEAARLAPEGVLEQAPVEAPTFFSKLMTTITEKMQKRAPGQDIINLIKKEGVKAEEIKWSGVEEFLKEKKTATKDEVIEFLEANQIEVTEVEKEDKIIGDFSSEELDNASQQKFNRDYDDLFIREQEEIVEELGLEDPTKFSQYTLPGGENYKELLLTLPDTKTFNITKTDEGYDIVDETGTIISSYPSQGLAIQAVRRMRETDAGFISQHFDEPNILAHVRFNERTDAEGNKVLFLEEVQSDWALEARKKGVKEDAPQVEELESKFFATKKEHELARKALSAFQDEVREEVKADNLSLNAVMDRHNKRHLHENFISLGEELTKITSEISDAKTAQRLAVPAAPFIQKNWHELALKRMLRYAAENDFDSVAWISGQQTADRYDLSKQIDFMEVQEVTDAAGNPTGNYNVFTDQEGTSQKNIPGTDLERYIGKELAQKAIERTAVEDTVRFEGVDLKVGGEWAFTLYDKVIPNFLKKYGKKWGATVGEAKLKVAPRDVGLAEGIPLLSDFVKDKGYTSEQFNALSSDERRVILDEYAELGRKLQAEEVSKGFINQSIPITDSMKKAVLEVGQPLFQRPQDGKAKGYYDPANSLIRLTESSNLSTFLHEFAHFMYDMELSNPESKMTEKIHNWFKRNAESVAQEANSYVGKEGEALEQDVPEEIHDFFDLSNEIRSETFNDFLEKPDATQSWSVIQPGRLDRIWTQFSKTGFVRDEKGLDAIVDKIIKNTIKLGLNTELSGHTSQDPKNVIEDLMGEEFIEEHTEEEIENLIEKYTDSAVDENGTWRISDYGLPQLQRIVEQIVLAKTPEEQLVLADQALNVVHQRSDLAAWFVKGGSMSLTELSAAPGELAQAGIPTPTPGNITAADVTAYLDTGTSGDVAKDGAIERAVHEQFARGFETYLMEGKAPSVELRNVFRAFARWLTQIYRAVGGDLKVDLDEEMRQVFARLLATEEQINAAEARAQFEPMFTDAAMAGMDQEEFERYQERQSKTKDISSETLRDKMINQLTRQTEKWWKEEKADVVEDEIEKLKTEKVYVAKDTLLTGTFKLDRPAVKALVGEERVDRLGRKTTRIPEALRNMTAAGGEGVHPDEAAGFLGYNSGDEMVQDLINAPTIKKAAAENAEQVMVERHGDIMNDGTIEKEADEAVQNEERGNLILIELKALSKDTGRAVIERNMLKTMAEENIGKLSFRNIHPGKYRKAEIRAAQEAATALAAGNKEEAATAKAKQALNFYLGVAATNAKNDTMKIVDRMARYRKKSVREAIMKAGGGYWEQLTKILTRFEFRKGATLGQVDRLNENIVVWAKARIEEDGDGLVLSPEILDEGYVTHWKNVPYDALQGVNDSVKNIEHVARYSNKITRQEEEITFHKLVDKWVNSMNEKVETRFKSQRTDVTEGKKWGRWAMAQMTKIPYLASWLDGQERAGLSHDILVQPFTDAYNEELQLWNEVGAVVMEAIANRSKEDLKRHNRKLFIPAIKDADSDGNVYGHQVLAVALNTGNESNLKKMLLGEGWANPDVEAEISFNNPKLQSVLNHMTKSDWEMVQLIWDQMDQLYPKLAEVHRKTTGLTPPKVESTPVETEFGTFKGGYYPVKYDPNRSIRAQQNEDRLNAETESMFGRVGIQASVNASSVNERTGYYAPIRLSLDIVPNHFQETIHYITHHDAVRETNKLIRNESVAATIKEKLGPEEYAQLRPWLNDIAKDGREAPVKMFWGSILQRLRFGTTLGVMGFKASTGIIQILGLSNTIAEVGSGPVYQSIRSILGSTTAMQDAWDFAVDNSKVMEHRVNTMDREIKSAMQKLEGKRGIFAAVQESSMKHIALIQTYMVDLPSWHAAYIKGMTDWGDEKRSYAYADWVIENIQGSGITKDMAQIMRNQSQESRMFTMFMTFFSSLWNQERDVVKGARAGTYSRTTVAAKMMFLFAIPVYIEMVLRGDFGDDDDDDSNLQKYLTNLALYPVQSVPFLRDAASAVVGEYGYNISPIAQILETGTKSIPELATRAFTDEEITKGQVKGATKFVGAAVGVPGVNQAWATGEHLYDVLAEGEEFTLNQLLYGPRR